jgi:hypothetical protein
MLGRIISALAGRSAARSIGGAGAGPMGAIAGAALPMLLPRLSRRFGPGGMIAAAVGGYALTKYMAKRQAQQTPGAQTIDVTPADQKRTTY